MKCILSTNLAENPFYTPGQNKQCPNFGAYPAPGELAKHFSGNLCKEHYKYLVEHYQTFVQVFKQMKVPLDADKGQFREQAVTAGVLEELEN